MMDQPDLINQLVNVRDVLESYRCCQVVPLDWYKTLSTAASVFSSLPGNEGFDFKADLVDKLTIILEHGLEDTPRVLNAAAEEVAFALSHNVIPGMPAPEDASWEFKQPSAS